MNFAKARGFVRRCSAAALLLISVVAPRYAAAQTVQERIWFPAYENVTSVLVGLINAEPKIGPDGTPGRIDVSAWLLSEHSISIALRNAFVRGVDVRLMGDRVAINENDPTFTRPQFFWLAMQGIPIRIRFEPTTRPEINHWKAMIFKVQKKVAFGSANFTPSELKFNSSTDYKDETVLVTNDPPIVNAFLRQFDHLWAVDGIDDAAFLDWDEACAREPRGCSAPYESYKAAHRNDPGVDEEDMFVNPARLEPNYLLPPEMVWSQGSAFNNRLVQEINVENTAIDLVVYRLTVSNITNALLSKFNGGLGVPVRVLLEFTQYWTPCCQLQGARAWPEFWLTKAYIDKLWAAGVPIRRRVHQGLTHMKLLITSRYATNASSNFAENWQRDHNYFIPSTKPDGSPRQVYIDLKNRFEAMWDAPPTLPEPFGTFTPTPPDATNLSAGADARVVPAQNATGVSTTPTLTWMRAPFATSYDIYIGTTTSNMTCRANVPAALVTSPPVTYSWPIPANVLQGGTTYFWRVTSRTFAADRGATGTTCPANPSYVAHSVNRSFTTVGSGGGGQNPPPLPSPWQSQDVGSVAQAGSASSPSSGAFTVSASGANIWGTADGFHYVHQSTSTDTQITAKVTQVGNTSSFAKAGIMLRASTAANSAHVVLSVRPNNAGLEFMTRTSTGGQTTFIKAATQSMPAWIRLTRVGSTVTAAVSANGTAWTDIESTSVSFSSTALAGLVVCANSTALNTSTFDNVLVTDSE